ncbi:hypothetical protein OAF42_01530 [Planctomicrobium sp.]|nr:papain-like cysteine protease family protein [Planctomicrobium sp.]MDB4733102.1 hypothetical protein [Planctomicrobium sp.]MDB4793195.1 hypothetical protein [bacterium]
MPSIVYEKPEFVRQGKANSCWYACLRMLKGFHTGNTQITESPKIKNLKSWFTGRSYKEIDKTELEHLVHGARAIDRNVDYVDFYDFLKANGPFMGGGAVGLFGMGHAIFIYGLKEGVLMYHDPFTGPGKTMDLSTYKGKADGEFLYKLNGGNPAKITALGS